MENKNLSDRKKANRVLYMVIVTVLCITALIIGLTAALSRRTETPPAESTRPGTDAPTDQNKEPEDNAPTDGEPDEQPTELLLLAPLNGTVSKKHSAEVLVYSMTMNDFRVHQGIDIATTKGAGVYSSAAGTVSRVWKDPMMGQCVSIDHGNGIETVYKNLAETLAEGISENAKVTSAQLIGAVGETAMLELADEPHLHFEVYKDGLQVDPLEILSADSVETGLSGSDAVED